jgi:hypothetical protein
LVREILLLIPLIVQPVEYQTWPQRARTPDPLANVGTRKKGGAQRRPFFFR